MTSTSRGVKDLRDLVMVSRLSYRDSGSDSDDSRGGMITPFQTLKMDSWDQGILQKPSLRTSPTPTPPSSADSGIGQRRRRKKRKPKGYVSMSDDKQIHPSATRELHPFPRSTPLPAVGTSNNEKHSRPSSSSSADSATTIRTDYSSIIDYLDEKTVADWLERANQNLKGLTVWCTDINFVQFAQFWITDFGVYKRFEILELEHSILLDELTLAVQNGLELQKVQQKDIVGLLGALLREYPGKLTSPSGVYLFLDYLDTFTSERTVEYRQILADVKLSTQNKQHVQLILASRSFMLINVWMAIITFYRQLNSQPETSTDFHLTKHRDKHVINSSRMIEAINLGLVEVVHYFLYSGNISAGFVDSHQKSLLHVAVAANKPKVVEYLLKKWTGCVDVNRPCDTGNSPLHVAVNIGNPSLVQLLLRMPDIEVNKKNEECNGATPLHLAVLHGNAEIVRLLLKYGAAVNELMSGQSVLEMARDFDHTEIIELLTSLQGNLPLTLE